MRAVSRFLVLSIFSTLSFDAVEVLAVNNTTVTITTTTNAGGLFFFPADDTGTNNLLQILSGGTLIDTVGFLADGATAQTNFALVSGGVWSNTSAGSALLVGRFGSGNQLTVTNGGIVDNAGITYIGNGGGNDNAVLLTGSSSLINNASDFNVGGGNRNRLTVTDGGLINNGGYLYIGPGGYDNRVVVTNGGRVNGTVVIIGEYSAASSNNLLTVTGSSSILSNSASLFVGRASPGNQMIIRDGGTVIDTIAYIGLNSVDASKNSVLVTGSGSTWRNTSQVTIGGLADNNQITVDDGATMVSDSILLGSAGGNGNRLVVTNGGHVYNSSLLFLNDTSAAGTNQQVIVTGAGSVFTNGGSLFIGRYSTGNRLEVRDGGTMVNGQTLMGASAASASNNTALVTGSGSVWSNKSLLVIGNASAGNLVTVTDGGLITSVGLMVGGAENNMMVITNGGHYAGTSDIYMGGASTASNNLLKITGAGSTITNAGGIYLGYLSPGNQMEIADGGYVSSAGFSAVGHVGAGSNNLVTVTGSGSVWSNSSYLVVGNYTDGNRLVISNGGSVFALEAAASWNAGSGNSILVQDGGLLEANALTVPFAGNSISNRAGIYQFTTATPTLTGSSRVSVTNGTVSFRGIDNASVAPVANLVYSGDNNFRLNASSNAVPASQSYTFDTGMGATNYAGLQLVNGTTAWRSQRLTIGANGSFLASNTLGTVAAVITNIGVIQVVNSHMTWASNVVLSGSYVSDPSTNTFMADMTVTPSGTLAGGVGDLFDFKKSLFIQSTNSQGFKLQSSAVQFSGGGMHTNEITGLDLGGANAAYDAAFAYGTNFAYGELHLGSASDEICFTCINAQPSNALYVGWLDLLGSTNFVENLHASNNITIYYAMDDIRNSYLGNQTFQLTQCDGMTPGGFLAPVIPEPTTMMLFALGACAMHSRRRSQ